MWLYKRTSDNRARFILGEPGENNLICFGINPSTAEPDNLDSTLKTVKKLAGLKGFDGWIMLNVYPQRATNPNDMAAEMNAFYYHQNLIYIEETLTQYSGLIWAAWGTLIEKRPYLKRCLQDIVAMADYFDHDWKSMGKKSKAGHPHHPLYLRHDLDFDAFNVSEYVRCLKSN